MNQTAPLIELARASGFAVDELVTDENSPQGIVVEQNAPFVPNVMIAPNDYFSFDQSARTIFPVLAKGQRLFLRGRNMVELSKSGSLDLVTPARLRTMLDETGQQLFAYYRANDKLLLGLKRCSEESAKALMTTSAALEILPEISVITASPVLVPDGNGQPVLLENGYHPVAGGVLVTGKVKVPTVSLAEAKEAVVGLLADFDFLTPGDHARALVSFISPALRIGGWLKGNFPVDVAEADQSQSGKTFRQRMLRAVYGERAYVISQKDGGVGSMDESLASALLSGRTFIAVENTRGSIDTTFWEMVLTWGEDVALRVPHRGEILLDCSRVNFQMTSNGVETTRDLANRSSIIRIRKRPADYAYQFFPEGDILAHIEARQGYYLGCVHAIIRTWLEAGKPATPCNDHDFRAWAGTMNWFAREIFQTGPLMEGHRQAQERVSNPAMAWLRAIALEVVRQGQTGKELAASEIVDLGEQAGIKLPGLKTGHPDHGKRQVGILMARCLSKDGQATVDDVLVCRTTVQVYSPERQENLEQKRYTFTKK